MVGVSFFNAFSSPGTTTTDSAERIGMRPVMNEARPAVQLAWPYQHVNIAPSLAIRSTFGVGWPRYSVKTSKSDPSTLDKAAVKPCSIILSAGMDKRSPKSTSIVFFGALRAATVPLTAALCDAIQNTAKNE